MLNENFQLALTLLAVGMSTVFFILGMVVLGGRLLIFVVNFGEKKRQKKGITPAVYGRHVWENPPETSKEKTNNISPEKIAAIVAAVEIWSGGRARIQHIRARPFS